MFYYCEAQKLEIKYYPSFHLNGRIIIMCNGDTCTLRLDVVDRKDSSKMWWSETQVVPIKYLTEVKNILETASHLPSYRSQYFCADGMSVSGIFESDTSRNEFVFDCMPNKKGIIQYDFLLQNNKTMRKVLKNRKSKRYVRVLREYL